MKVRIKFRKYGEMKFIGHLDMMRFFQKALRRAEIPVAFTGGFSPHMVMSFASPLGVGITSDAEYFDLELAGMMDSCTILERLNTEMPEGAGIISVTPVKDGKKYSGMAIVAAADYLSTVKNAVLPGNYKKMAPAFFSQPEIRIMKKTKTGTRETDIKPMIYRFEPGDDGIFMRVRTGSMENIKPELVMEAFCGFLGMETKDLIYTHHRLELYARADEGDLSGFISLDKASL